MPTPQQVLTFREAMITRPGGAALRMKAMLQWHIPGSAGYSVLGYARELIALMMSVARLIEKIVEGS